MKRVKTDLSLEEITRVSLSKDQYQESHLAVPFGGWSRGSYRLLAVFAGAMALLLFEQREAVLNAPFLGWAGYLMFQIMFAGLCVFSLYGSFRNRRYRKDIGARSSFTWWGFWLRELFMATIFLPFAVVVTKVLFSGAGEGYFIELGGWPALFDPATPLAKIVPLFFIGFFMGLLVLLLFYLPLWMLYRSFGRLFIQFKHGLSTAIFDQDTYTAGTTLRVRLYSRQSSRAPMAERRVFLNYVEDLGNVPPPSSAKYKRNYRYTIYQDVNLQQMEQGLVFELPTEIEINGQPHVPTGPDRVHYWEVLVEEPESLYWARFFFVVK